MVFFLIAKSQIVSSLFILGSVNGLLCISNGIHYFIWNPSTRELKKLPLTWSDVKLDGSCGFGYNDSQDDYRIVVVARNKDGSLNEVRFYSLTSNSWQKILEFPAAKLSNYIGKLVQRRLHWIAESGEDNSKFILSIDLVDETYRNIALPNYKSHCTLECLGGNLCVYYDRRHDNRMNVWVMKEHGGVESWIMLVSVPGPLSLSPLFVFQSDEILLELDSSLQLYNSTHETFKAS